MHVFSSASEIDKMNGIVDHHYYGWGTNSPAARTLHGVFSKIHEGRFLLVPIYLFQKNCWSHTYVYIRACMCCSLCLSFFWLWQMIPTKATLFSMMSFQSLCVLFGNGEFRWARRKTKRKEWVGQEQHPFIWETWKKRPNMVRWTVGPSMLFPKKCNEIFGICSPW